MLWTEGAATGNLLNFRITVLGETLGLWLLGLCEFEDEGILPSCSFDSSSQPSASLLVWLDGFALDLELSLTWEYSTISATTDLDTLSQALSTTTWLRSSLDWISWLLSWFWELIDNSWAATTLSFSALKESAFSHTATSSRGESLITGLLWSTFWTISGSGLISGSICLISEQWGSELSILSSLKLSFSHWSSPFCSEISTFSGRSFFYELSIDGASLDSGPDGWLLFDKTFSSETSNGGSLAWTIPSISGFIIFVCICSFSSHDISKPIQNVNSIDRRCP